MNLGPASQSRTFLWRRSFLVGLVVASGLFPAQTLSAQDPVANSEEVNVEPRSDHSIPGWDPEMAELPRRMDWGLHQGEWEFQFPGQGVRLLEIAGTGEIRDSHHHVIGMLTQSESGAVLMVGPDRSIETRISLTTDDRIVWEQFQIQAGGQRVLKEVGIGIQKEERLRRQRWEERRKAMPKPLTTETFRKRMLEVEGDTYVMLGQRVELEGTVLQIDREGIVFSLEDQLGNPSQKVWETFRLIPVTDYALEADEQILVEGILVDSGYGRWTVYPRHIKRLNVKQ